MLDIDVFIEKTKKKSRLIGIDPGGKRMRSRQPASAGYRRAWG